jgi:hypothetical protein
MLSVVPVDGPAELERPTGPYCPRNNKDCPMNVTPTPPDGHDHDRSNDLGLPCPTRIHRVPLRKTTSGSLWNLEMFESPLLDSGIPYTVHDTSFLESTASAIGWIELTRPTETYRDPCGDRTVRIRLTVEDGRLAVTAPDCYARGSLMRTTAPPADRHGNLRLVRLGDDDLTQIDLIMAADGEITASLRMDTLLRPFTRHDIVQITDEFALGIDLLDFAVRKHGLLIHDPERQGH